MKATRRYDHLLEDEKSAVLEARKQVTTGNSYAECESGSAIDDISTLFRRYELWHFSPTDPSVQQVILDSTPKRRGLYQSVQLAARGVLFDLAFDVVCGSGVSRKEKTLESARARTKLIVEPDLLRTDDSITAYVAEKLRSEGRSFLNQLSIDWHNAERRKKCLPIDLSLFVLAQHWVNPHCPLWMMTAPVMEKVLRSMTKHGSWTSETIRKRLKILRDAEALRFPGYPIFEVELRPIPKPKVESCKTNNLKPEKLEEFQTAGEVTANQGATASAEDVTPETTFHRATGMVVRQFSVLGKDPGRPLPGVDYSIKFGTRRGRSA